MNKNIVPNTNVMHKLPKRTHPNCFRKIVKNFNNFRTNIDNINMIETVLIDKNTCVVNSDNVYGMHFDLPEIPDCKMTISFRKKWVEFGFGEQTPRIAMLNRGYIGLKLRALQNLLRKTATR